VTLVTPEGFPAELHRPEWDPRDDLQRQYRPVDTTGLADLVGAGVEVEGRWTLHVSDNMWRDVGRLKTWSLFLRTAN
ncbi:MAG: proprotein convertase P-domain-containing protein, partial [Phycisphaerae bacterium]|jgi:subtilisin-like proprotein convertase family protein